MTTQDMIDAFGHETTTNANAVLDSIHDDAWSVFNTYTGANALATRVLVDLQGAFASMSNLLSVKTEPQAV